MENINNTDNRTFETFKYVLSKWKAILGLGLAISICTALITLAIANKYTSSALLAPIQEEDNQLSGLIGNFGGLASMAGINLNSGSTNKDYVFELLKSKSFAYELIDQHNLIVPIIASKSWNSVTNELNLDDDVYDIVNNKFLKGKKGPNPEAYLEEAYKIWKKKIFSVSQDRRTSFVSLTITHHSPILAKNWAEFVINKVNKDMREKAIEDASTAIEFLNIEAKNATSTEIRSTLYQILEKQLTNKMLANTKKEYVFDIIDNPFVPEEKSFPSRAIIVIFCGFISVFFSIGYFFLKFNFQNIYRR